MFLTQSPGSCFLSANENESRVDNDADRQARQWTRVHLAVRSPAVWQRGFRILSDYRKISENPRLPVNRGFFVGTERPDGLGTTAKAKK